MDCDVKRLVLNLLARREHSQEELRRKLIRKGIAVNEIDEVLAQFIAAGWQSNRRFTEAYIRMRIGKGYGPLRIQIELRERGIASDLIEECLNVYREEWTHYLHIAWQKKFAGKMTADLKNRVKQTRFLQQRGFELSEINRFLKNIKYIPKADEPNETYL